MTLLKSVFNNFQLTTLAIMISLADVPHLEILPQNVMACGKLKQFTKCYEEALYSSRISVDWGSFLHTIPFRWWSSPGVSSSNCHSLLKATYKESFCFPKVSQDFIHSYVHRGILSIYPKYTGHLTFLT